MSTKAVSAGKPEKLIQSEIQLRLSNSRDTRVFRNQVGTYRLEDGRVLRSGLAVGSADLIGWQSITITPEMVGQQVAVFLSVEVKSAAGKLSVDQTRWLDAVNKAGGIAIVTRSADDAPTQILKCLTSRL
jgi:hypothetical protein